MKSVIIFLVYNYPESLTAIKAAPFKARHLLLLKHIFLSVKLSWARSIFEGRNHAQRTDDIREVLDNKINFFLRGVAGEGETDGAVGIGKGHTHGAQHMRRFKRARRTGRTGGGADVVPVHV